jgi:hypothetical protein
MFENIFPKDKSSLSSAPLVAAANYDGQPNPLIPLRLLQHVDAPCWQVHAYLVSPA